MSSEEKKVKNNLRYKNASFDVIRNKNEKSSLNRKLEAQRNQLKLEQSIARRIDEIEKKEERLKNTKTKKVKKNTGFSLFKLFSKNKSAINDRSSKKEDLNNP